MKSNWISPEFSKCHHYVDDDISSIFGFYNDFIICEWIFSTQTKFFHDRKLLSNLNHCEYECGIYIWNKILQKKTKKFFFLMIEFHIFTTIVYYYWPRVCTTNVTLFSSQLIYCWWWWWKMEIFRHEIRDLFIYLFFGCRCRWFSEIKDLKNLKIFVQ